MGYVRLYTETTSMNSYYYEELSGEIFLFENKRGGNGLCMGTIAGISLVIFTFVRKIEKSIPFDANLLYWISTWIGVILGVFISGYMLKRAKRKIERNVRIYPCGLEELRTMAKQNRKWFFKHIVLVLSMGGMCAVSHFLMIWVVPSVPIYAFFNLLMCLMTTLMLLSFAGSHPIKGWKIAGKILTKKEK